MGYYDFPHTRNYDTDLGYLITQYLNLREEVNTLLASQTITYADPLQWSITTQYAKNYIVINGYNAYLSKQPVPAGILISNTDYWLTVGDFIREFEDLRKNIAEADEGSSTTATANRTKGSLVWLQNTLYKVLSNINIGDSYVVDSNIQLVTLEEFINEMVTTIDNLINNLTIKLNQETYNREKGDEDTLIAANRYTDTHANSTNRKYIFIGDSYGLDGDQSRWITLTIEQLGLSSSQYYRTATGATGFLNDSFLTMLQNLDTTITDHNSITDIVACCGYNDNATSKDTLITNITSFVTYAKTNYTNAKIHIGMVGWGVSDSVRSNLVNNVIPAYQEACYTNKVNYIPNAYLGTHDYSNFVYNDGNYGVHPVDYNDMGYIISSYLKGIPYNISKIKKQSSKDCISAYRTNDSVTGGDFYTIQDGNTITLNFSLVMSLDSFTLTARSGASIAKINDGVGLCLPNPNLVNASISVGAFVTAGGSNFNEIFNVQIISGNYIRITPTVSHTNVTQIIIQNIVYTLPANVC